MIRHKAEEEGARRAAEDARHATIAAVAATADALSANLVQMQFLADARNASRVHQEIRRRSIAWPEPRLPSRTGRSMIPFTVSNTGVVLRIAGSPELCASPN